VRLLSGNSKEIAHLSFRSGREVFVFPNHVAMAAPWKSNWPGLKPKKVPVPLTEAEIKLDLAPIQEQVNVTANLTETPTEQVGSSVTTISAKEIADRPVV